MSITNFFKKTVLTGALLAGSLFAAQNAYSQDHFNEDDKPAVTQTEKKEEPKQEKKVSVADDDSTVLKKVNEVFRGTVQARAETSPLVDRILANTQFELKAGDFRPYFGVQGEHDHYKNIDGSKLNVNSIREILACGWYLKNTSDLELYFRPVVGREDDKFSDSIDMEAGKWIAGAEFGIASQKSGTKALFKFYEGIGNFDADLLSGYQINGRWDSTFAGIDFRQRLYTDGKTDAARDSRFDEREQGTDAQLSIDLLVELDYNRNKFGDLETDNTFLARIGPQFIWNWRDAQGKGSILSLTPYVGGSYTGTSSDISLRKTHTTTVEGGVQAEWAITRNLSVGGSVGLQYNGQKIDDPGQYFNKSETKNGGEGAVWVTIKF